MIIFTREKFVPNLNAGIGIFLFFTILKLIYYFLMYLERKIERILGHTYTHTCKTIGIGRKHLMIYQN